MTEQAMPEHMTAAECLARVRQLLSDRDIEDADEMLNETVDAYPEAVTDHQTHLYRGQIAVSRERYREARRHLRMATRGEGWVGTAARYELGRCWLAAERPEMAIDVLGPMAEDEETLIPYRVHALSALCVAFSALDRRESAQHAIEAAAGFSIVSGQLLADEAFRLLRIGGRDEAKQQLARALQIDHGCVDAFALLGNLFHIEGRSDEAIEILNYGLEHSPHALKLYAMLAEVHGSRAEHAEAAAYWHRCIELSPQGANADAARLSYAKELYRAGRGEMAAAELRELLASFPRSRFRREARERLAALDKGATYSHAIDDFPRDLQRRDFCGPNTMANVLTYLGVRTTQDLIAEHVFTNGTRWHDLVGWLKTVEGMTVVACLSNLNQLRSILALDIPVIVGEYHGMEGHCVAVIGYDDRMGVVIVQDPNFYDPVEIPYGEFVRSWEFTDSLAVIVVPNRNAGKLKGLGIEGEELVKEWLKALHLRADGRLDKAMKHLESLLEREPHYSSARRTCVEMCVEAGAWDQAARFLEQELEANDASYWALRYMGDVALQRGNLAEAWECYARAVRIFPDDPTLHYIRGEIALMAGDRRRGRAELVRALEESPDSTGPRLRLAREYADARDWRRARYHAEALLEYNPGNPDAQSIVDLCHQHADTVTGLNVEFEPE